MADLWLLGVVLETPAIYPHLSLLLLNLAVINSLSVKRRFQPITCPSGIDHLSLSVRADDLHHLEADLQEHNIWANFMEPRDKRRKSPQNGVNDAEVYHTYNI